MIRAALILFLVAALAVIGVALSGPAGHASMEWLGWRLDMTAAAAILLVLALALISTLFWRALIWLVGMPQREAKARAEALRRQGIEALTRGFLAASAGDGSEARRLTQKSVELAQDMPGLVRILAAQAAEASGDHAAVVSAYTAMLGFPDMRLAALKGLMQAALGHGDRLTALRHAQEAYALAKTARWAWRALLEHALQSGNWTEALALLQGGLERKIVPPVVAERGRAALLAATAAGLENADGSRERSRALDLALQSVKLKPDFAPGVVMAARLSAVDGKVARATSLIEAAWKERPHPALWLAYRDLKTNETPKARAVRLLHLANLNAGHRESQILMIEQALLSGDRSLALSIGQALTEAGTGPTARLCGLMARVCLANAQTDEARAWMTRGTEAPQEPDWSDLDPEGGAFAYSPADWARLTTTYAETGELIHPRFERRERSISELPALPIVFKASAPFVAAAEAGSFFAPLPDDPGPLDDDRIPAEPISASRPPARRRLGSGARPAK
jgi:HemY protein